MINHPNRSKVKAKTAATSSASRAADPADYTGLLEAVSASFHSIGLSKLFLTDADGLNDLYLKSLPLKERQHHNCHACRRFIETYGALAAVGDDGRLYPAMWGQQEIPALYRPAFDALHDRIMRARIESPFLTSAPIWGTPITGAWSHMAVTPPPSFIYRERLLTPSQAMAAAKENLRTVAVALTEFTAPMLDEALRLLQADALARSERFVGPVKWLRALHDRPKGRVGENLLWRAIASAPEGYCHPRASVVGPLLEDIAAGLPFADIKRRFEAKVHPLAYQRPQAAPTIGTIKAAEIAFEKLGLAASLERRFARLDELQTVWKPAAPRASRATDGLFGHIKAKNTSEVRSIELPAVTMTWSKFAATIMPSAEAMQIQTPALGRFIGLTTATHADAPGIMKWEHPFSWFIYPNGSPARLWSLSNAWTSVIAVTPLPSMWQPVPRPHLGEGMVLVLEGCWDTYTQAGNALFPEQLRDDLHAYRSVIEAYSRSAKLAGRDNSAACGLDIRKSAADCVIKTLANGAWTTYRIDRWD